MVFRKSIFGFIMLISLASTTEIHDEMDTLIENEITHKLTDDLIQSLERKFQGDLERSVDMVLMKIRLLLQNGTQHVHDKLAQLQGIAEDLKTKKKVVVLDCLHKHQNETVTLVEKTLHQMVVCGYALIGHDPANAVAKVIQMKQKIREGLQPISSQRGELFDLLKLCGHDHDSLKAVIKCVISKSPLIKTAMMDVTQKLMAGVVDLTKLMAHGAMHEACLIEVINVVENEALELLEKVRVCTLGAKDVNTPGNNQGLVDNNLVE